MRKNQYNVLPSGVGPITSGIPTDNSVDLDLLLRKGSRAQKRWALKKLRVLDKLRAKNGNR
jgi:hypothetical protein